MCLKGTTSQDMYGSTPVAMYKESVLRRSAFQAHRAVLVDPDTACPVTIASLCSAFQALSTNLTNTPFQDFVALNNISEKAET